MYKPIIAILFFSFFVGYTAFAYYPRTSVSHISGDIALKTKTELIGESDVIISGKVKELLPSKWSNEKGQKGPNARNIIQTDILVKVNEIFKGDPYDNKTIAVRIDKGQIGNYKIESEGYPDFSPSEELILFLSKDDSDLTNPNENYYVLTGMEQGKFKLNENQFINRNNDIIKLDTIKSELPIELEKFKKLPKPADPKVYRP